MCKKTRGRKEQIADGGGGKQISLAEEMGLLRNNEN